MDLAETRDLLARLSARAPRQAVDTLLEFLALEHSARLAALFRPEDDVLKLFGARALDQHAIDWAQRSWTQAGEQLARGSAFQDGGHVLVPIMRGPSLIALLYLETPVVHHEVVLDVEGTLAAAILRAGTFSPPSPIDDYLETTPEPEIARRKMVLLCERHEWNLSRVARALGLSRQGIYRRLETLGITRERVPKGIR